MARQRKNKTQVIEAEPELEAPAEQEERIERDGLPGEDALPQGDDGVTAGAQYQDANSDTDSDRLGLGANDADEAIEETAMHEVDPDEELEEDADAEAPLDGEVGTEAGADEGATDSDAASAGDDVAVSDSDAGVIEVDTSEPASDEPDETLRAAEDDEDAAADIVDTQLESLIKTPLGLRGAIEAVLFTSPEPLTPRRVANAIGSSDARVVTAALQQLRDDYDRERRGIQVMETASGWQMATREMFGEVIMRLKGKKRRPPLSAAALETLAIIAYRQPMIRAEIEAIRGVESSGTLRNLLDMELVQIVGRKDVPGRPPLYGTTAQFLEAFGLRGLDELPDIAELKKRMAGESALGSIAAKPAFAEPSAAVGETMLDAELPGEPDGSAASAAQGRIDDLDGTPEGPDADAEDELVNASREDEDVEEEVIEDEEIEATDVDEEVLDAEDLDEEEIDAADDDEGDDEEDADDWDDDDDDENVADALDAGDDDDGEDASDDDDDVDDDEDEDEGDEDDDREDDVADDDEDADDDDDDIEDDDDSDSDEDDDDDEGDEDDDSDEDEDADDEDEELDPEDEDFIDEDDVDEDDDDDEEEDDTMDVDNGEDRPSPGGQR